MLAVVGDVRAVVLDAATGGAVFLSNSTDVGAITHMAMSPSGKVMALGREDGSIEMRTSDDGLHWPQLVVGSPHSDGVSWIDFDSRSERMVSTSHDGVATVWDTATGLLVAGPEDFGGDGGSTTYFRPDSWTILVNVDGEGHIRKWEPPQAGLRTTVLGANLAATVSASPQTRVLVSSPEGAVVYEPPDAEPRQVRLDSDTAPIGVAASADGKRFVVVSHDGSLELHDSASGALVRSFDQTVDVLGIDQGALNANNPDYFIRREIMIALDRGGTLVAFQASDQRIHVIDDNGTIVRTIELSSPRLDLQALDLSDDGSQLVISTRAGEALWYDVASGDTKTLAPGGAGFDAQFVETDRVAVVGRSGVQIIDPRSSQTTKSITPGNDARRLAVDGTGRLLATAGAAGSIQLWDATLSARIGAPLLIRNISSPVPMRFSADGHYLVVSGPEETTWVDVSPANLPRLACDLVKEKLSPDERALFLGSVGTSEPCP